MALISLPKRGDFVRFTVIGVPKIIFNGTVLEKGYINGNLNLKLSSEDLSSYLRTVNIPVSTMINTIEYNGVTFRPNGKIINKWKKL